MGTAYSGAVRTAMTARLSLAPASVVLRLGGHLVHAIAAGGLPGSWPGSLITRPPHRPGPGPP
jgi:hypothetical protein